MAEKNPSVLVKSAETARFTSPVAGDRAEGVFGNDALSGLSVITGTRGDAQRSNTSVFLGWRRSPLARYGERP